jgi:hypothetical protein
MFVERDFDRCMRGFIGPAGRTDQTVNLSSAPPRFKALLCRKCPSLRRQLRLLVDQFLDTRL